MHRIAILAVFSSLLFRPSILDAGTATQQFTVVKDTQAVTIIQAAVAAMGGVQAVLSYQDSAANGTVTVYGGKSPLSLPITLKSKGTHETRIELQRPEGIAVRIVNQGQGVITKPDGKVIHLLMNNTFDERVNHIPLLSILAEYQDANISAQYQGAALLNAQNVDVIAVSLVPSTDPIQGPIYASLSRTLFHVNKASGLVDKIQFTNSAENDPNDGETEEIYLSDYRLVDGIFVPFRQVTYKSGKLESDLVLNSIAFNVGLLDSDFTLPN